MLLTVGRDLGLTPWLQRLREEEASLYALRVLVALGGVMAWCWWSHHLAWLVPLFLGVIGSALAETDDSWRGRLRTQLITLACFSLVAFAIEAVVQMPWAFAVVLCSCAFAFTLMGAVGERYRAVATASLILALYTAMSVGQSAAVAAAIVRPRAWSAHAVPMLVITGAAWYGLLSVLWSAAFPLHPVRQGLARLYGELSGYLSLKASLFEPVRGMDVQARRLALAQANGRVVAVLNVMKEALLSRMPPHRAPTGRPLQYLNLYFIAQDIHERASSSHYHYNDWADELFHSDVLYRCQRVLHLQGVACARLAEALRAGQPFRRGMEVAQALVDLDDAIGFLEAQARPHWQRPLRSLRALARNLTTLDGQLTLATEPLRTALLGDVTLLDRSVRSWSEGWERIRQQLRWNSPLLRYAVRLAVCLAVGCAAMQMTDPVHGHWILLTTIFVCQPTYGATVTRVTERMAGTVLGLVVGWACLRLFPGLYVQALLSVVAGVVFFVTRSQRYVVGTAAITLMVMLCFNQTTGNAYSLIFPRVADTLLGSLIAAAGMLLVLPDWQGRRLNAVASQSMATLAKYLQAILSQYAAGKDDDLDYRVARRDAHNADAAFSQTLSQLLLEPGWARRNAASGQRMLVLSHTVLNYISALGAHRGKLDAHALGAVVAAAGEESVQALESIAKALRTRQPIPLGGEVEFQAHALELERSADDAPEALRVVLSQLALIARQMAPLSAAASRVSADFGEA